MKRGASKDRYAECLYAGLPKTVAERELTVLKEGLGLQEEQLRNRGLRANEGPGNALLAVLHYEHITEVFAACGEKGTSAEQMARQLLKEVRNYQTSSAPVGTHLADQLMIPLALASLRDRKGRYRATALNGHTQTNARTIEKFLPLAFVFTPRGGGVFVKVVS